MSHGPDTGYGFPADIPIGPVADGRIELREADGELRVRGFPGHSRDYDPLSLSSRHRSAAVTEDLYVSLARSLV